MAQIQFFFFNQDGAICIRGKSTPIAGRTLVITHEGATATLQQQQELESIPFYRADFQEIYLELTDLLKASAPQPIEGELFYQLPLSEAMLQVVHSIGAHNRKVLLQFICTYGLAVDPGTFASLLTHFVDRDHNLIEFIETNALKPWSVKRYASELGINVRKLNYIFHENYGINPKSWLVEKRLQHGHKLLLASNMRISDIALECGFNNHAHFSDSFKKRYSFSPSEIREQVLAVA
ncbi:helix-turn-helix domain-containing protein [Dongshaea marina]|uniref:helix-turn-helix domain-containing protein n=1 Tax=Dongshaea marina TaxID=2047966 RepID=UPI000D3E4B6C|nr:AraC family transcriptional regulator [Dongshaea marina]